MNAFVKLVVEMMRDAEKERVRTKEYEIEVMPVTGDASTIKAVIRIKGSPDTPTGHQGGVKNG